MLHINPRDEGMTRNESFPPDYFVPGYFGASYEPVVPNANFKNIFALKFPYMWGETTCLEDVFCGADLFPGPATVLGGVMPPFLVPNVSVVYPFYPERIFLVAMAHTSLAMVALFQVVKFFIPIPPLLLGKHVDDQEMWGILLKSAEPPHN